MFTIVIWIFFEPTMENTSGRLILQVLNFGGSLSYKITLEMPQIKKFPSKNAKKCSSIVDPQKILILPVTILNVRNLDSTGKKDDKFSAIIFE